MDGAPLALMLARRATIDLAESGGPHGRTVAAPRRRPRRLTRSRDSLARTLHRVADAIEVHGPQATTCSPAR